MHLHMNSACTRICASARVRNKSRTHTKLKHMNNHNITHTPRRHTPRHPTTNTDFDRNPMLTVLFITGSMYTFIRTSNHGVVHSWERFQKRTMSTLFLDSLPEEYTNCWLLRLIHTNNNKWATKILHVF